jgi:ferritin-like metal-binding protein YciE
MATNAREQLIKGLREAHALEEQAKALLERGSSIVGDTEIAAIYRAHLMQTGEHARYVAERLDALGSSTSKVRDAAMKAGALGIGAIAAASPKTPMRLATVAFAFENVEIATYRFLRLLAQRAEDAESVAVIERILEQEEAAAELVAGTFERSLELTLGEEATSPVPAVTPIGKPSEREPVGGPEHPGPQQAHETPPDKPIAEPPHVETPTEGEHLSSPEPGHPAGETKPSQS